MNTIVNLRKFIAAFVAVVCIAGAASQAQAAKNVILMISDGCGYNVWNAASMYEGKWDAEAGTSTQVYNGEEWVEVACATFMATQYHEAGGSEPSADQLELNIYDPVKAWDATNADAIYRDDGTGQFEGYNWLKQSPTDSAAAATAMSVGQKTFKGSINWGNYPKGSGTALHGKTIAEIAREMGKKVGSISTVEWTHATPAALGGVHNFSRNNYADIANELLEGDWADVVMGAGHPLYNNDGSLRDEPKDKYVGGMDTWNQLVAGTHPGGWTLVQEKADFEALANGTFNRGNLPAKVCGTAQANATIQQSRGGDDQADAFAVPFNQNVPDLATMSLAAINVLNQNPRGFYLHIEGGAVDWAGHANQKGRIIEEQIDFNKAVEAVANWVETNSSWDETLLIVTTDHDTGMLWGPNSDTIAYDPIVDNGAGNMPGMMFNSSQHTNQLIPLFARGPKADMFLDFAQYNMDPVYGHYCDNTQIFDVMKEAIAPAPEVNADASAKNIILLISDGCGYNVWDAASMYEYGATDTQPYEQPGWFEVACTTFMATQYHESGGSLPSGGQLPSVVYSPEKAWNTDDAGFIYDRGGAGEDGTGAFKGYNWLKQTPTDSAAAGTAISTGFKTFKGSINWANYPAEKGVALDGLTIAEISDAAGKSVGSISSVEWTHATPAALGGAHNLSRNNYADIANELLNSHWVDVVMGAGHPLYNDDGTLRAEPKDKYVGGMDTWNQLVAGTHPGGWTLIEEKTDFEALADGSFNNGQMPAKVCGTAQANATIQQSRGGDGQADAFAVPFNQNVPDLATMTKGAINVLKQNPRGFFLHIEGGAVDWAGHANQAGRIIEEQIDFNNAVKAVIEWVESESNWNETLVIVTTDHETGMMWGPNSDTIPFDPVVNNGQGNMPGVKFNSFQHTNQLIPVYAKGPGSEWITFLADETDPVYGPYMDNTDIFSLMNAMVRNGQNHETIFSADGVTVPGGWVYSEAFGYVYDMYYPWVLMEIGGGWIFIDEETTGPESIKMYTPNGWCWTSSEFFPWIYNFDEVQWKYAAF